MSTSKLAWMLPSWNLDFHAVSLGVNDSSKSWTSLSISTPLPLYFC